MFITLPDALRLSGLRHWTKCGVCSCCNTAPRSGYFALVHPV